MRILSLYLESKGHQFTSQLSLSNSLIFLVSLCVKNPQTIGYFSAAAAAAAAAAVLLLLMEATLVKFSMIRVQCCLYCFKKWGSMRKTPKHFYGPIHLSYLRLEELLSFLVYDDSDLELKEKIEPVRIERLLNLAEPRSLVGFEKKVRLLFLYGIPKEKLAHVLNTVNLTKALCLKSLEEIERMLTYLQRFDGVHLILRRPAVLNYDLDTQLIPRIGWFVLDLSGGDESATASVLYKFPLVLSYTVDHVKDLEFVCWVEQRGNL